MKTIVCDGTRERTFLRELRRQNLDEDRRISQVVSEIIEDVRQNGDAAVRAYTEKFDKTAPIYEEVPRDVLERAPKEASPAFVAALQKAKANITDFHTRQKTYGFTNALPNGVLLGQRVQGVDRVGLYVPGGTAAYPSSVLMNAIPAKIAGVGEIVMVTPPGKDGRPNPDILTAAALCGIDRVFLCGGAQAIAALAFGTETRPHAVIIGGPCNIYVATAKKLLYGQVDIDMVAGPSEILVLSDHTGNPKFIAADLMGQAEHDVMASPFLVTTDPTLPEKVEREIRRQLAGLSRRHIIEQSLENRGAVLIARSREEAVSLANDIAPEHLEVHMERPLELIGALNHAGSVFLGSYASEPLGDYYAGPNHVLPTSGTARFFSPLGVDSFVKRSSYIYYTKEALAEAKDDIVLIAEKEGLTAHANAIKVRFEEEEA